MRDTANASLHAILRRRAHRLSRDELARRMGYRRVDEKLLARIDYVLGDALLGLDASHFDFRYSGDEFLVALCDALDIDPDLRAAEHARIRALVSHRNTAFRPVLFVDTGFRRRSEPVFVLGLMEPRRWLRFDRAFVDQDLGRQFAVASERVISHYRDSGGVLPLWGVIQRYQFQYADTAVLIFDTEGRAVAETDAIRANRATTTLHGADATAVIKTPDGMSADDGAR